MNNGGERWMDLQNESPCTESGTRTFTKECVVVADNSVRLATVTMTITTLRNFQKENTEALLKGFAQSCRLFYLEVGNELKAWP